MRSLLLVAALAALSGCAQARLEHGVGLAAGKSTLSADSAGEPDAAAPTRPKGFLEERKVMSALMGSAGEVHHLEPEEAQPEASADEKAEKPAIDLSSVDERLVEEYIGIGLIVLYLAGLCACVPMISREKEEFSKNFPGSDDSHFYEFLEYRFTDWFLRVKAAPVIVLVGLSLGVIVCASFLYAMLVGGTPSRALFKMFVWAAAASADSGSLGGRFIGILVTVAGLIILSLLLGIVADAFASWMRSMRMGMTDVIEGGHVVILGLTECTRCLLEELALAKESDGGATFVLLAAGNKEEIENEIKAMQMDLKNSRLIIRTGRPFVIRDLSKVAVGTASQVILLADTSVSREESDAKSIRALLAMKCKEWPVNGAITVQCCSEANRELMSTMYDKVEVVVVGDIVAKLMVNTARQPGLAGVFGMMLGFDGDEFYSEEWENLKGMTFRDAIFRFPDAVALGLFNEKGECKLNPGWDYRLEEGDSIIVLAEDNDTYKAEDEPYFDVEGFKSRSARQGGDELPRKRSEGLDDENTGKVLILGWNDKLSTLLVKLDGVQEYPTTVEIYSPRPVEDREEAIENIVALKKPFKNLTIKNLQVDNDMFTSRLELERLNHETHEKIFILADVDMDTRSGADEKTVCLLSQLQYIRQTMTKRGKKMPTTFNPVVEMCEDSTKEHLNICGLNNLVHSVSLVAQALAAVAEDPKVNAIYSDLMSQTSNEFDICRFEEFLPSGKRAPDMLSFGEATYRISLVTEAILVAWSDGEVDGQMQWTMNPKDKITPRRWTSKDRCVVIRRIYETMKSPRDSAVPQIQVSKPPPAETQPSPSKEVQEPEKPQEEAKKPKSSPKSSPRGKGGKGGGKGGTR